MFEWLEFEEHVGRFWHRWASDFSRSYPYHQEAAIKLADIAPSLAVFFRAGGGSSGVVVSATSAKLSEHRLSMRQRLGFDQEYIDQALLDDEHLLLPPKIALFSEPLLNRDLYFWLAAMLAIAQPTRHFHDPLRQDISLLRQSVASTEATLAAHPGLQARYRRLQSAMLAIRPQRKLPAEEAAIEAVIRYLLGDTAPLSPLAEQFLNLVLTPETSLRRYRAPKRYRQPLPVPLWGYLKAWAEQADQREEQDEDALLPAASEQVQQQRQAERRQQDQAERDDPLIFNRFEKILSLAEMVNVNRMVDDEEDENLKNHAEQIDQITLSPNQQRAASRLKIDLDLAPLAAETGALQGEFTYPEWHYRKQLSQPDHCRVIAQVQSEEGDSWAIDDTTERRIRRVRRQFEALRPKREWLRGQVDGNELDMDAVVRAHCDFIASGQNSMGLYQTTRAQARDLAISILIDVSLSTDAWVEDRRIIDIEKEALLILAHGIAACGDDYSIQSFTSHRRHRVWVNTLKGFDESMNESVARRIAALKPGHYTRMGAAIRHVSQSLSTRPNRHRLLLVLSDGKPNDSDYYEGRYAVEDTRRAVLEARQQGLKVFGVTIDRDSQDYIGHLYGRGGYAMVNKPEHLSQALPRIYQHIINN